MKTGKTLMELAQALTAQKDAARDYVVPTEKLAMIVESIGGQKTPVIAFQNGKDHAYNPTGWAHSQIAGYTDIPKAYYDRIAVEKPELLAENVNHGLQRIASVARASGKPEARMIRTVGDTLRASLSSRYRRLDCHDLLEQTLPVAINSGLELVSSELTERRMFLKMTSPRLRADVKVGDTVQYGLMVSSSDVGAGAFRVEPYLLRLACLNGMVSTTTIRKFHIGKNQAEDDINELLSDSTKELTDAAFYAQARDVIIGSMRPEMFEAQVDRLRVAANEPILNFDLPRVVELTMKATGITGDHKAQGILAALASGNEGAGLTKWGLMNSFTRAAYGDAVSYEDGVEMERAAGKILELPKAAWSTIASTAA